jgi:two-component system NarL family response regulator
LRKELLKTIRIVNAGRTYLPTSLAETLAAPENAQALTKRETQVLQLIVRGLANKQIAYALNISEGTTKNHVKSILSKLGAQDRTQAAATAIQRGFVHLSSND